MSDVSARSLTTSHPSGSAPSARASAARQSAAARRSATKTVPKGAGAAAGRQSLLPVAPPPPPPPQPPPPPSLPWFRRRRSCSHSLPQSSPGRRSSYPDQPGRMSHRSAFAAVGGKVVRRAAQAVAIASASLSRCTMPCSTHPLEELRARCCARRRVGESLSDGASEAAERPLDAPGSWAGRRSRCCTRSRTRRLSRGATARAAAAPSTTRRSAQS